MSDENEKKKSALDQVIMGAIIGTAIGSAIGVGLAPKKGKETREILKEKGKEAGSLAKETGTGLFKVAKKLVRKFFKQHSSKEMKEIPNEMEVLPPKSIDHE